MSACRLRLMLPLALLLAATAARAQVGGVGENKPELITEPYEYVSDKGEFKVTWPSGCGELTRREKVNDPDVDPFDEVFVYSVYCDQRGQHGVGCAVMAVFNLKDADGEPAGPQDVVKRLEEHMKLLGVNVEKQQPIRRAMPDGTVVEGLEIRAREPEGAGEAWMRGLLHQGDVFLLSAWNMEGGLFNDPEFLTFFNSFEPLTP